MSDPISNNAERFAEKYDVYVNSIKDIGSQYTNSIAVTFDEGSSTVVRLFKEAYCELYHTIIVAKRAMIKDWYAFKTCVDFLDSFDTYLALQTNSGYQSGTAMSQMFSGLRSSIDSISRTVSISDLVGLSDGPVACEHFSYRKTISSDDIEEMIGEFSRKLDSLISGCDAYSALLQTMKDDIAEVSVGLTATAFSSYIFDIHGVILSDLGTIAGEFKTDLDDYIQDYRYNLGDGGSFVLVYNEIESRSADIQSMISRLQNAISSVNTNISYSTSLPGFPGLSVFPPSFQMIACEYICEGLNRAKIKLDDVLALIDEIESHFTSTVNGDLRTDIGVLRTYVDEKESMSLSSACLSYANYHTENIGDYVSSEVRVGIVQEDEFIDDSPFSYFTSNLYNADGSINDQSMTLFKDYLVSIGVNPQYINSNFVSGLIIYRNHLIAVGCSVEEADSRIAAILSTGSSAHNQFNALPYVPSSELDKIYDEIDKVYNASRPYVVSTAMTWAISIANDNNYGYVWGSKGPGKSGYDCSGLVITSFFTAGVPVAEFNENGDWVSGASSTQNMVERFTANGFVEVSDDVSSVSDLLPGDVLVNGSHTIMFLGDYYGDGRILAVAAHSNYDGVTGDSSGDEISVYEFSYNGSDWSNILRYEGN